MAIAFHDRQIYKAPTTAELSQQLPGAEILLDGPRDLFIASWPNTIFSFVEKRMATPPHLQHNNPNYWYEELAKMAIRIEAKKDKIAIKKDFTFNAIAPIVVKQERGMNETVTKKDERKRKHIDRSLRIKKKVSENPRRKGTLGYKSWEKINDGMTVAEFLQNGGSMSGLRWDLAKGFVALGEKE